MAASANAQSVFGPSLNLPAIDPTQALRIVSGLAAIRDAAGTHFLTMLGAQMIMAAANFSPLAQNLKQLRTWQPNYGPLLLGPIGATFGFIDDEYVFGTDYIEFIGPSTGAAAGNFNLNIAADLSNSDAAPHNVTMVITVIVEIYQRQITPVFHRA